MTINLDVLYRNSKESYSEPYAFRIGANLARTGDDQELRTGSLTLSLSPGLQAYDLIFG